MARDLTLLCLPCAGASATMYLRWRRRLPAWLRVRAVELPGRGARIDEEPLRDADALVALLSSELCDELSMLVEQGKPYALFGHSMGAMLAHRLAYALRAAGLPSPSALLVSACPAPGRRDPERFAGCETEAGLIADLRRQGGTPDEVMASPELLRLTLDLLAADYALCARVWGDDASVAPSGSPLSMPVHVLAGNADDIETARLELWSLATTGPFTFDRFDGGHFYLREHEDEFLARLVELLEPHVEPCDASPALF